MKRRFRIPSLSRLLGLGDDTPKPAPESVGEFLNPYQPSTGDWDHSHEAGERFRDWYLDEHVTALAAEMEAAATTSPHTRPLINSQAGLQAHIGGGGDR